MKSKMIFFRRLKKSKKCLGFFSLKWIIFSLKGSSNLFPEEIQWPSDNEKLNKLKRKGNAMVINLSQSYIERGKIGSNFQFFFFEKLKKKKKKKKKDFETRKICCKLGILKRRWRYMTFRNARIIMNSFDVYSLNFFIFSMRNSIVFT